MMRITVKTTYTLTSMVALLGLVTAPVWAKPVEPVQEAPMVSHAARAEAGSVVPTTDAAAQDAAADAALIEKAKQQADKDNAQTPDEQDAAADKALMDKACTTCVPLGAVEKTIGEGVEQTPTPHAARVEAGSEVVAKDVKSASRGDVRVSDTPQDINDNTATPKKTTDLVQDAVYRPEDEALDKDLTVRKTATAAPTKAVDTEDLAIPASTGNPVADAQSTLGAAGGRGGVDPRDMVTGGEGRISSGFGHRESPGGIGSTNHKGVDIAAPSGTPVYAAADGVVTQSGMTTGGYGVKVTIQHADGTQTIYAHLNANIATPVPGTTVRQGQMIGGVGSTGNSTGNHLHYEVRKNGTPVNPMTTGAALVASLRGTPLSAQQLAALQAATPMQTAGGGGNGSNTYNTNASYNGGVQVGGGAGNVQFQYGNTLLGSLMQLAGLGGITQSTMPLGAGGALQTGQQPPVIILTAEQYAQLMGTGQNPTPTFPDLTTAQNGQIPTDCTNQTSTQANEDLLRQECVQDEDDILNIDMV